MTYTSSEHNVHWEMSGWGGVGERRTWVALTAYFSGWATAPVFCRHSDSPKFSVWTMHKLKVIYLRTVLSLSFSLYIRQSGSSGFSRVCWGFTMTFGCLLVGMGKYLVIWSWTLKLFNHDLCTLSGPWKVVKNIEKYISLVIDPILSRHIYFF